MRYIYGSTSNLEWYSLSQQTFLACLVIKSSATLTQRSITEPVFYRVQSTQQHFKVVKIDCKLGLDHVPVSHVLYEGALHGESVEDADISSEQPGQRRVVHVYLKGREHGTVVLYDIDRRAVVHRTRVTHVSDSTVNYLSIRYNPSATHCCVIDKSGTELVVLAVNNNHGSANELQSDSNKPVQERASETGARVENDQNTKDGNEKDEHVYRELDSLATCFKLKCQLQHPEYEWLNDDILAFKTYGEISSRTEPCQHLYSVARGRVIGAVRDDISFFYKRNSGLYMKDNVIIAFTKRGSVYRIILDPNVE